MTEYLKTIEGWSITKTSYEDIKVTNTKDRSDCTYCNKSEGWDSKYLVPKNVVIWVEKYLKIIS